MPEVQLARPGKQVGPQAFKETTLTDKPETIFRGFPDWWLRSTEDLLTEIHAVGPWFIQDLNNASSAWWKRIQPIEYVEGVYDSLSPGGKSSRKQT